MFTSVKPTEENRPCHCEISLLVRLLTMMMVKTAFFKFTTVQWLKHYFIMHNVVTFTSTCYIAKLNSVSLSGINLLHFCRCGRLWQWWLSTTTWLIACRVHSDRQCFERPPVEPVVDKQCASMLISVIMRHYLFVFSPVTIFFYLADKLSLCVQ